jgi:hypothetical protein
MWDEAVSNVSWTMGIDQLGTHYDDLGLDPKAKLLDILSKKSASKMYIDSDNYNGRQKDGTTKHVGYIISDLWITLYRVEPWEQQP